jgi:predicted negative regulator of RcsB-dependent stress response
MRALLIVVLVAAVGVLGYLYWEDQQNSVSIELEAPSITTN